MGSENFQAFNDSDKDSDREDGGEAFLQHGLEQYIEMNPRKLPRGSDSSADEPGMNDRLNFELSAYVPLKPPTSTPDLYVQMGRPGAKGGKVNKRTSDSYHSPEEEGGGEKSPDVCAYVNMKPGLRHMTSSSSSDEVPGNERFDHLNRGESSVTSVPGDYVNMAPRSASKLKKSHSQTQRNSDNAYMNVDVGRSKSVGKEARRFRIVSEQNTTPTSDGNREVKGSYVNVKANDACAAEQEANYANFVPLNCHQNAQESPVINRRELNYASVEFPKDSTPPQERRSPRRGKNRQDNYSKIDFEKSHVLADISSTRERQLHHA
jgi:hypothetical protein